MRKNVKDTSEGQASNIYTSLIVQHENQLSCFYRPSLSNLFFFMKLSYEHIILENNARLARDTAVSKKASFSKLKIIDA